MKIFRKKVNFFDMHRYVKEYSDHSCHILVGVDFEKSHFVPFGYSQFALIFLIEK